MRGREAAIMSRHASACITRSEKSLTETFTATVQQSSEGIGTMGQTDPEETFDSFLCLESITKYYGDVQALDGVSLKMPRGSFLVLLGPSGCGKTTTMRSIVGLETPNGGRISLGGRTLYDAEAKIDVPVHKREMGMVFQSYAIWPHRTVFENTAFALRVQKRSSSDIKRLTMEALELVGLAHLAPRGASNLSGGQMQRVALARSIVMHPKLLLLDEPLSNLDAQLRDRLRVELKRLQQELGITTVYVTHDQSEALAMADKVAVIFGGKIHQFATPQELYIKPATIQVAAFLGRSNFLPGRILRQARGTALTLNQGGLTVSSDDTGPPSERAIGRVRVEDVAISSQPTSAVNELRGWVSVVTYLGSQTGYFVEIDGGGQFEALVPGAGAPAHAVGDEVYLSFSPSALSLYDGSDADLPTEGTFT